MIQILLISTTQPPHIFYTSLAYETAGAAALKTVSQQSLTEYS